MTTLRKAAAGLAAAGLMTIAPVTAHAATTGPDLAPKFTVSKLKAPGHLGLVALRIDNVGPTFYYGDSPAVQFVVKVHTVKGPRGVDRVITPHGFDGATVQDLGFDAATSTRSFRVVLANGIKPGRTALVANFNFADGLTTEGRLVQEMSVSQVGRIPGDHSSGNDQDISSVDHTFTDFGRPIVGRF